MPIVSDKAASNKAAPKSDKAAPAPLTFGERIRRAIAAAPEVKYRSSADGASVSGVTGGKAAAAIFNARTPDQVADAIESLPYGVRFGTSGDNGMGGTSSNTATLTGAAAAAAIRGK